MPDNSKHKTIYDLTLYIMGASPNSARAVSNIRSICNAHLNNRYELKIVDVYQQPVIAQQEQLVALPMLIKNFPLPVKKFVGNMADESKIVSALEIDSELLDTGE